MVEHDMGISQFRYLTYKILSSIGITKVGHQIKIINYLQNNFSLRDTDIQLEAPKDWKHFLIQCKIEFTQEYEIMFNSNCINITQLPMLNDKHLKQIGITKVGHRLKILTTRDQLIRALLCAKQQQVISDDHNIIPI